MENAVGGDLLARLQADFSGWIGESRGHAETYGETLDGRPRVDLEGGHSADKPELRWVHAPIELSDAYYEARADSRMTDAVAELIGPNVKLHHTKIKSKLQVAASIVKWHQDFPFTPHSNDDRVLLRPEVRARHRQVMAGPPRA